MHKFMVCLYCDRISTVMYQDLQQQITWELKVQQSIMFGGLFQGFSSQMEVS
jgi:hypothetical protein